MTSRGTVAQLQRWYFADISSSRLQTLRGVLGGFMVLYLGIRLPFFLDLADNLPSRWEPTGVLNLWDSPWPDGLVIALVWTSFALALVYASGFWFRIVGPAFTVALLLLFSYRGSWGQLLHFENLMLLQVGILSLAPAGRSSSSVESDGDRTLPGWPVRLMAIVTALTYVLAGWSKLRFGGASWLFGDTLRNHVASATVRRELLGQPSSPLGRWMVGQGWMFPPLAVATVALELGALLALVNRTLRNVWVGGVWLMHLGIGATMLIVFPLPFFGVAFLPFFAFPHAED